MMNKEIKEKINEAIKKALDIVNVNENISQKNTEEWDSLKHLNLIVELESVFDVSFEPEEIAEMVSYSNIVKILELKGIK